MLKKPTAAILLCTTAFTGSACDNLEDIHHSLRHRGDVSLTEFDTGANLTPLTSWNAGMSLDPDRIVYASIKMQWHKP